MTWILYLLECKNGAFYAGITNDLGARFAAHQAGKGARYTRANPPVKILASKYFEDRSSASVAEAQVKRLARRQKLTFFDEDTITTSKHGPAIAELKAHPAPRAEFYFSTKARSIT